MTGNSKQPTSNEEMAEKRREQGIQRRADGDFRFVQLPVLITVEAHPMTDGRTYLVRTAPNFSFTAISDDEHDLSAVGRECGKFFDYALGGDLAQADRSGNR